MNRLRYWVPAFAYMALIFLLSSMHLTAPAIEDVPFQDKGVHFLEYLVLGSLCAYATRHTWPAHAALRTHALGFFLSTAWGFSDELHQAFVPGRSADVADLFADALGSLAGVGLFVAVGLLRRRASPLRGPV